MDARVFQVRLLAAPPTKKEKMNIFVFDEDTKASAQYFFSKDPLRARKQIVEATQMIAIAADSLSLPHLIKCNGEAYKVTSHRLHPCSKWVRESLQNLIWTIFYTLDLCTEYERQSGKPHMCHITLLNWLKSTSGWLRKHSENLPEAIPEFFGDDLYTRGTEKASTAYKKYRIYLRNKLL